MPTHENRLEELLDLAASDPGHRPEFYTVLLESDVFFINGGEAPGPGERRLEEGTLVRIQHWQRSDGTPVLPFFTSLHALQQAVEQEVSYLRTNGRALFELTRGATLVINPHSQWGKEFLPEEVAHLLAGALPTPELRRHEVKAATELLIGQPARYPQTLVQALSTIFLKLPQVRAAYLAMIHEKGAPGLPRLLIGVDAEGDFERVLRQAGSVVPGSVERGTLVDFIQLPPGESDGVPGYLTSKTTPFYRRGVVAASGSTPVH